MLQVAVDLRSRAAALRDSADRLDAEAETLERQIAGADAQARILRGAEITAALAPLVRLGEILHYTEMERLLRAAGFVCAGKDSAATLLAALNRSSHFESVRPRSGLFRRLEAMECPGERGG